MKGAIFPVSHPENLFLMADNFSHCVVLVAKSCFSVTPWTVVHEAALPMGFSDKNTGVDPSLLHWQVNSLPPTHQRSNFSHSGKKKEPSLCFPCSFLSSLDLRS